jgi:hypothetical protein
MTQEQPETDSSEQGLLERLGNALAPEAPADEAIEASQEEDVADDEQPEEAEEAPAAEEFVEIEIEDGRKVKVAPEAKDGYLRQSDYTRKTQELATLQKNATAALQQQALLTQYQQFTQQEQQELAQIQSELKRLKEVDWTGFDTETYIKTRGYIDNLKDKAADLEKALGTKQGQLRQHLAQQRQQAAANAYDYISRHVKGWAPDSQTEQEVARYAGAYGVPPEALAEVAVMFPGFAVMAAKASQFDKLQTSKGQAVEKAQKAPPVVKPGAVTSTNNAQQQKASDIRSRLKKSGDWKDAAALFMMKGK